MFWADLSNSATGKIIDGQFTTASATVANCTNCASWNSVCRAWNQCFPDAKIGKSNSVYVGSSGGLNYFGIEQIYFNQNPDMLGYAVLTVRQVYDIDKKIDDGLPQSGRVMAVFNGDGWNWAPNATTGTSTTCFDSGGINGGTTQYSLSSLSNYGLNGNCALLFQFQ